MMKKRFLGRTAIAVLVAMLVAALGGDGPARAANIEVTTLVDENGTGPACSLREAIEAANTDMAVGGCVAGSGADTITFAPTVTGTITLTDTLPATGGALAIQGPGAGSLTISGGGAVQILSVGPFASLTLSGLTLANGRSGDGSAILNASGSLTITNSTFSGNTADNGGAIRNNGSFTITNSTFSGNQASSFGGAIVNDFGSLTITNSTFSGNQANFDGGAIFTASGNSRIELTNSTIANNQSGTGAVLAVFNGSAGLHNVVLANPSPSCGGGGAITDQGGNIASDATCPVTTISSRNDTDPLLGPLQNNGGPTQTMALLTGSPAIDAGVDCPPPATDQRGVTRPQGVACDSGAYELE
ncbi:MAG: choice-of-anchor Q domain-containing protein, partial [Dehalococcoidia bacterium]